MRRLTTIHFPTDDTLCVLHGDSALGIRDEHDEDLVGSNGVVEGNPAQRSGFWVHGRLPELVRVHFAQTLEPGDIDLHVGIAAAQFAGNLVALLV